MKKTGGNHSKTARRALKTAILLTLSCVVLGAVVYFVGVQKTVDALRQVGAIAFVSLSLFMIVQLILQGLAWSLLNRPLNHRIPLRILVEAAAVGMAVNIMTPSSYLGGEPFKVIYAGRKTGLPYQELAGNVVLCKYLEAISFLLFFGCGTGVAVVTFRDQLFSGPYLSAGIALCLFAVGLLGLCVVLWLALSRHWKPLTFLVARISRIWSSSQFLKNLVGRCEEMETQVTRVFKEYGHRSFGVFCCFFLIHVVLFVRPAIFFALGSGLGLGLGELSLIFVASQALGALQLTPSGVGIFDGGLIGTFAVLGIGEPMCMAFLLCLRFWDAAVVGLGIVLGGRVGAHILTGKTQ